MLLCRGCHQASFGGDSLFGQLQQAGYPVYALGRPHIPTRDWRQRESPPPPLRFSSPWIYLDSQVIPDESLFAELDRVCNGKPLATPQCWCHSADPDLPILGIFPASSQPLASCREADLRNWWKVVKSSPMGTTSIARCQSPYEFVLNLGRVLLDFLKRRTRHTDLEEIAPNVFSQGSIRLSQPVAFDVQDGPIVIEEGVQLSPFCSLIGPIHIGKFARIRDHAVLRGPLSIGEHCKIGGEVEHSIFEDYSNKGHFGYVGHSYLGSWVNLGAGTTCSNLKHTYGTISIATPAGKISTGMQFLGMIANDFSRTSIQCGIMTGKTLGAGSFSYGQVAYDVPPFVNYAPQYGSVTSLDLETVLRSCERMMLRRNFSLSEATVQLLTEAYLTTASERVGIPLGPVKL